MYRRMSHLKEGPRPTPRTWEAEEIPASEIYLGTGPAVDLALNEPHGLRDFAAWLGTSRQA
jgi:hypothetical protein